MPAIQQLFHSSWMRLFMILHCVTLAFAMTAQSTAQEEEFEIFKDNWVERLTAAPEDSNWSVGARFGTELSKLPGDQAYEILKTAWEDIADSVRPQILKGLKPAFKKTDGINDRIFNIFHMAYHDPDERVQQFAKAYINALTFSVDAEDTRAYRRWYLVNKDKSATDIIVAETTEFSKRLKDLNDNEIKAALDQINDAANDLREFSAMRQAAADAGMMDAITSWVEENKIRADDIRHIASNIMKGSKLASAPPAQNTNEFEGLSAEDRQVGGNEKMSYFLMTRDGEEQPNQNGFKLVLILPGGSGSADFKNFCRRIHKHAIPEGYVVVQLVAPVWSGAEDRVVWPTNRLNPDDASFNTEEFINAVVEDVGKQMTIDDRYVFTLGWSSGGPPIYSAALQADSPVTGTFVAMSVFKPNLLPDLKAAKDRAFYLLHSPDDWIKIDQHAREAEKQLSEAGAAVKLQTYRGGHGWREDPYGHIRRGIRWLEERADK